MFASQSKLKITLTFDSVPCFLSFLSFLAWKMSLKQFFLFALLLYFFCEKEICF